MEPHCKGGLTVYELSGDHEAIGRREGGKQLARRLDESLQHHRQYARYVILWRWCLNGRHVP